MKRRDSLIRASDLARLGYCETKFVLDRRKGERVTPQQRAARRRGDREHARFHHQVQQHHNQPPVADQRCFIASHIYGVEDSRTQQLREWRDQVLDKTRIGRVGIRLYYRIAPTVVRALRRFPVACGPVRWALDQWRNTIARSAQDEQSVQENHRCPDH